MLRKSPRRFHILLVREGLVMNHKKLRQLSRGRPLAAAGLRHIAGTTWSTKRYRNIELLKDQQMRDAIPREPGPGAAQPTESAKDSGHYLLRDHS
jgi:hypothetical protein